MMETEFARCHVRWLNHKDTIDWLLPFGQDYESAWRECPKGSWLAWVLIPLHLESRYADALERYQITMAAATTALEQAKACAEEIRVQTLESARMAYSAAHNAAEEECEDDVVGFMSVYKDTTAPFVAAYEEANVSARNACKHSIAMARSEFLRAEAAAYAEFCEGQIDDVAYRKMTDVALQVFRSVEEEAYVFCRNKSRLGWQTYQTNTAPMMSLRKEQVSSALKKREAAKQLAESTHAEAKARADKAYDAANEVALSVYKCAEAEAEKAFADAIRAVVSYDEAVDWLTVCLLPNGVVPCSRRVHEDSTT